jgi:hypothetical protein
MDRFGKKPVQEPSLQNRMTAAPTMIGSLFVKRAVIVVKNQMLTLKANYIRDPPKIAIVFSNYEGTRIEREDHARGVDEPALVIVAAGVLSRGYGNVWRVLAFAILESIGTTYEDRVIVKSQAIAVAMAPRHGKEIGKSTIDGIKECKVGHRPRQHGNAAWGIGDYGKAVPGKLLSPGDQSWICWPAGLGVHAKRQSDQGQRQR